QIASNMALLATCDDPDVPHQLRIGLRRLRAAFLVFRDILGAEALRPLSDAAQKLGQIVSPLRDLDVLIDQVVGDTAARSRDAAAHDALVARLDARRLKVRAEVRNAINEPAAVGFIFDLGRLSEGRGWLDPADDTQSTRLATPIGEIAGSLLDARLAKVRKRARGIRKLNAEAL